MCSHLLQLSHCSMGRPSSGRAQMQRVEEGEEEDEVERMVEGVVVREEDVEGW